MLGIVVSMASHMTHTSQGLVQQQMMRDVLLWSTDISVWRCAGVVRILQRNICLWRARSPGEPSKPFIAQFLIPRNLNILSLTQVA